MKNIIVIQKSNLTREQMLSKFAEFNANQVHNSLASYAEAHQNFEDVKAMSSKKLSSMYQAFFN